jgi:spore coat protein U-like protein
MMRCSIGTSRPLQRLLAGCIAAVLAGPCLSNAGPDLTELSLEQLMQVELPPLAATAQFRVSATAVESCTVTVTDLAFGSYDMLDPAPTDAVAAIRVACTIDAVYHVGLNAGAGAGATVSQRSMQREGQALRYGLFSDPGRRVIWGNTVGVDALAGVGTGMATEHAIYGRIAPRQPIRSGHYADTVTATLFY